MLPIPEIITILLSLLILIIFFVMAANIAKLKKQQQRSNLLLKEISNKIKLDEISMVDGVLKKKDIKPWECLKCKTINKNNPSICESCNTVRADYS